MAVPYTKSHANNIVQSNKKAAASNRAFPWSQTEFISESIYFLHTRTSFSKSARTFKYVKTNVSSNHTVIKKSLCTWWYVHNTENYTLCSKCPPPVCRHPAKSDCLTADRQGNEDTKLTLTPSIIPNSNYVIMVSNLNSLKYFYAFLYCNHQVHRDFLIIKSSPHIHKFS
jgi:hypothetical protein